MSEMKPFSLRVFKQKAKSYQRSFRRFLTNLEGNPVRGITKLTTEIEQEVWKEVDCLACANCCKTMTPTFTPADIKRIANHLGQTPQVFKDKWLKKEKKKDGDWINKVEPCQFLNLKDNKCSIYEVRPADCAGFPHLPKKMGGYAHVHKQNIEFCPATFKMVEKMIERTKR
ncbi:MAG: YkgJ family cysteine cluster protein [Chitinophagaceae bacterium]